MSPAGHIPFLPTAAVDADGNVLYAWDDFSSGRIAIRARSASGEFGDVEFVSPTGDAAINPRVAMTPGGKAVIVWLVNDNSSWRVRGRARTAAGGLGQIKTFVTGDNVTDLSIALDGDGDAYVVWRNGDHLVQMRVLSKNGTLGPLEEVVADATDTFSLPRAAVAPDGRSQVAWLRETGGDHRVEARTRDADGMLRPIKTITGPDPEPITFSLAGDAENGAHFAWMESDLKIVARIRPPTGPLGAKRAIGTGDSTNLVDIAADDEGDALIVWSATDGINARPFSATGTTGTVKQIAAGDDATAVDHQTLEDGRTVILWMTVQTSPFEVRVFARLRRANGSYASTQRLSPVISNTTIPFLAVGPNDDVVAAWTRTVNAAGRVETIFGP